MITQRCSGHWEIAGYQGEKVVLLAATDSPYSGPASNVSADVRVGMNVDYQAMDFRPVLKRRESSNRRPRAIPGLFMLYTCNPFGAVGRRLRPAKRSEDGETWGSARQTSPSGRTRA